MVDPGLDFTPTEVSTYDILMYEFAKLNTKIGELLKLVKKCDGTSNSVNIINPGIPLEFNLPVNTILLYKSFDGRIKK